MPTMRRPVEVFVPDSWNAKKTEQLAFGMMERLVDRNQLFGSEDAIFVSQREREALLLIFQNCQWIMLSRVPDAAHPGAHSILAFRPGKSDDLIVSPSGSDLDYVLMPVDRRHKGRNRRNTLEADILQQSDRLRLYVQLETGQTMPLPLRKSRIDDLKEIRDALNDEADETIERNHFTYVVETSRQHHLRRLANAFNDLIDGIRTRADIKQRHKSQNKMSPARRHSDWANAHDEIAEPTLEVIEYGTKGANRLRKQMHSHKGKGKKDKGNKKERRTRFMKDLKRRGKRRQALERWHDSASFIVHPAANTNDYRPMTEPQPAITSDATPAISPLRLDQPTLPDDFDYDAFLDTVPTQRYPLRLAGADEIAQSHRTVGMRKAHFLNSAKKECCDHMRPVLSDATLARILNKDDCDIHHILFTCLGGSNVNHNLLLIGKKLHTVLHQRTNEIIRILKDCETLGILDPARVHECLQHRSDIHFDKGQLWITLPCPEKKYLIPELAVYEERAKFIHLMRNRAESPPPSLNYVLMMRVGAPSRA